MPTMVVIHFVCSAAMLLGMPWVQGFASVGCITFRNRHVATRHYLAEGEPRGPSRRASSTATGPKGQGPPRRRTPSQRQNRNVKLAEFNGKVLTSAQNANEDAPLLDLQSVLSSETPPIRCMTSGDLGFQNLIQKQPPFEFYSLDDLFGSDIGFSQRFNTDAQFRKDLRAAIRQDIFDTTPFYANLSEKAASILLLPDSSLEGSWRMPETMDRMQQTTRVLKTVLGPQAPTGDEFVQAIGNLCGSKPTTHWIDIYGVQDRTINHSWHLDSGQSPENSKTVLLGFPPEDNYEGCGVFSHIVSLTHECLAPSNHPRMEPVLFAGTVEEQYIVRPMYRPGRELIAYRDIDVLHSAPDVTYRMSIMRFM